MFKTWIEYVLENWRRQDTLSGGDPSALDSALRVNERCFHELLVARRSPEAILRDVPEAATAQPGPGFDGDQVFGRHYTFFQQLHDVNIPAAWARVDADVLALWGEAEAVTGRDDHEAIAKVVEARHPGRGQFRVVPGSSHGFDWPTPRARPSAPRCPAGSAGSSTRPSSRRSGPG